MIHIGDYNKLTILRDTEPGLFLGDDEDQEIDGEEATYVTEGYDDSNEEGCG